jgi:hypothetical protein
MPFDRKYISPNRRIDRKQYLSKGRFTENIWKMVI